MAYWLVKSEPFKYSFEQLLADKATLWDGVRNYLARNHLLAMQMGDRAFFYHSNEGLAVVGVAEITKVAVPDPTVKADKLARDGSNPWVAVTLKPVAALPRPVPLVAIKAEKSLQDMALLKYGRLSVQPVTSAEWKKVCAMGGLPEGA